MIVRKGDSDIGMRRNGFALYISRKSPQATITLMRRKWVTVL